MPQRRHVEIYDTTLRDGTQAEEISYSLDDKLRIASELDRFGVDYIEGGWPGSNPRDAAFFQEVKKLNLKNAKIAAFGSTRRAGNTPEEDPNLKMLLETDAPVVTIVGKTWDFHVTHALRISLEENLALIEDSIAYLKSCGRTVFFDAEHFFDGYKDNATYALQAVSAAKKGGADLVVLCDTNGGSLPDEIISIVRRYKEVVAHPFGIHAHNDSELAVSNTLVAVSEGAAQVQGTINGYGERCGNANLCSIIPNLAFKMGFVGLQEKLRLDNLTHLSHFVSEIANLKPRSHQPFVGKSAFAHKGGIHVSAILKDSRTYEHISPALVGNRQRVLVSDLSGRSNIEYKAQEFGLDVNSKDPKITKILDELKTLEEAGYVYEGAEASFRLLMLRHLGQLPEFFLIDRLQISVLINHQTITEAVIKLKTPDEKIVHTAAEGNGPVNALDNALRKALESFYPSLHAVRLIDFKVRILDEAGGTGAKTRVLIQSSDGGNEWGTVGVSENVINASWEALLDSIRYKLLLDSEKNETH